MNERKPTVVQAMGERGLAAGQAIRMYAGEPCRICGRLLIADDLYDAVFAGYSDDSKSRAAHGLCWRNLVDVVRKAHAAGHLQRILE